MRTLAGGSDAATAATGARAAVPAPPARHCCNLCSTCNGCCCWSCLAGLPFGEVAVVGPWIDRIAKFDIHTYIYIHALSDGQPARFRLRSGGQPDQAVASQGKDCGKPDQRPWPARLRAHRTGRAWMTAGRVTADRVSGRRRRCWHSSRRRHSSSSSSSSSSSRSS
eukprot:365468-Chlamydomonas_euryale.AAC.3